MIFGMIILVLVAGVAFYHFVQGFFSSMISAVLVLISAMLAISYHEPVAESLFASVMPNFAHGVALVGLFAVSYVVLRLSCDRLIPGNIRVPVIVDKVGAAVFGVFAGIFATGVLALAGQLLPIGPDVAGYSRYATGDRVVSSIKVPGKYQRQDLMVYGELTAETLDPKRSSGLVPLPVDDITLGLASYLSDGGSLAGERSLASIHPSYLDQLFGQRLGPSKGADILLGKSGSASVLDVYSSQAPLQSPQDFEAKAIRGSSAPILESSGATPIVVRATFPSPGQNNGFNMASVRLVVNGKNFYPVGSLQGGSRMLLTRPDDTLYVETQGPVDFVFMVEHELIPPQAVGSGTMPKGSFFEIRRTGRVDLSGKQISFGPRSDSSKVGIVEKKPLEN